MMRKKARISILTVATLLLGSYCIHGQATVDTRIVQTSMTDNHVCTELQVSRVSEESFALSSQNYRLFYNAASMSIADSMITLSLSDDIYQLRVVQHVDGIDATGTGDLVFEDHLGFINFSIVHSNLQRPGVMLSSDWTSVVSICYDVKGDEPAALVLARDQKTTAYGRAYIELSMMDAAKNLKTTTINQYQDYHADN